MDPQTGSPRTPMSERQQLALIRCMESNKRAESPPRTPLRSLQNRGAEDEAKTPKTPAEEKLRRKLCKKNAKGETPLHAAAIKGRASLVRRLLALGASPNVKDNAGWSPLHEAANRGNLKVARILIRYGADVNSLGDGKETPLHDAARNGHFHVVEYLVRSGASLTARNISGSTPLDVASHPDNRCRHPNLSRTIEYLRSWAESGHSLQDELQAILSDDSSESSSSSSCEDPDEETLKFLGLEIQRRDMKKALVKQQQHQSSTPTRVGSPFNHQTTPTHQSAPPPSGLGNNSSNTTPNASSASRLTVRLQTFLESGQQQQQTHSSIKTRLTYGMEDNHSAPGSTASSSLNTNAASKEDVYEFKSSSKEATPVRSSTSPEPTKAEGESKGNPEEKTAGEKRPPPEETSSEEDHKRKKPKKDEAPSKGRGSRGGSMEKAPLCPKQTNAKTRASSLVNEQQQQPPQATNPSGNSSSGSPKKPESESEDDDNSKKSTDSSGLKVPPLKIVLSGNNGSGSTPPGSVGEATSRSEAPSAASSNSNNQGSSSTPGTESNTPNMNTSSTSKKTTGATTGRYLVNKDDNSSFTNHHEGGKSEETSEGENNSGGGSGNTGNSEKGGRMTRSKAHQGTPGPEGFGDSQGASSSSDQAATDSSDNRDNKNPSSDYSFKKRKLRSQVEDSGNSNSSSTRGGNGGNNGGSSNGGNGCGSLSNNCNNSNGGSTNGNMGGGGGGNGGALVSEPMNDIEKYLNIRKQIEQRRKNLFPVQPKPPQGFKDYLMNRKTYLLQENANERLRQIPLIQPPPSLEGAMVELFKEQEEARRKLRMKHVVEKEKLVLSVEQEILRVHGRAARALANQSSPYSLCTILRDEEIYTPIDPQQEEKNRDIRSRYNGRLFLSWLQDVDDKWERIKEQMVLRHHNEAESLNAVQKMDWEWKLKEISDNPSSFNDSIKPQIDDLLIPMVHVSDEFGLTDCRN